MKAFLFILTIFASLAWLFKLKRSSDAGRAAPVAPPQGSTSAAPQAMLRCEHCGIHLPASGACFDSQGRAYCCPAHREQN